MENMPPNPYPEDETINKFFGLYVSFLASSYEELDMTRSNVKQMQKRLDDTEGEVKNFETNLWGRLTEIIKILPVSKCHFCGGKVIDKSPLIPFINQFKPYHGDDGRFWADFWREKNIRFVPECISCHIFKINESSFQWPGNKKYVANDTRRPLLTTIIFEKYPFVTAIARNQSADEWYFALGNGEYWEIEGNKDYVIQRLNLPNRYNCGDY
jgi:hypothetical protein